MHMHMCTCACTTCTCTWTCACACACIGIDRYPPSISTASMPVKPFAYIRPHPDAKLCRACTNRNAIKSPKKSRPPPATQTRTASARLGSMARAVYHESQSPREINPMTRPSRRVRSPRTSTRPPPLHSIPTNLATLPLPDVQSADSMAPHPAPLPPSSPPLPPRPPAASSSTAVQSKPAYEGSPRSAPCSLPTGWGRASTGAAARRRSGRSRRYLPKAPPSSAEQGPAVLSQNPSPAF